jgi:hypothetical protein
MIMGSKRIVLGLALVAACKAKGDAPGQAERSVAAPMLANEPSSDEAPRRREPRPEIPRSIGGAEAKFASDKNAVASEQDRPADPGKDAAAGQPEGPTRAWFPETFLFEPLVVTDARGAAVVPVRVPDRLTTWRVLALAHARTGAQAGAVTSFLGTLPIYVDPVVPGFLVKGDQIELPIQIVNTTDRDVASSLTISAEGAILARGAGGERSIPAQGSIVDRARLTADRAGAVKLRVALGGADAVERVIDVRPFGRPVRQQRSGTLAAPRSFATTALPGADPATDRVRLQVFPGALALLRSELAMSMARTGVADDSYALLLAGKAAGLLAALGDHADPAALRELAIVTAQRVIRDARTLDVERAALLAEAALAHPGNPVLARLGERAAAYLAQNQRPDGTFSGATGWTLQRLLVVTAEATRAAAADQHTSAARQRGLGVAARAAGAFARTASQVTDGYTAAAILASGVVSGELADTLRRRVRGAIQQTQDGARYLAVAEGVARADGAAPGRIEATALAVLALAGDPQAPLADLGTTLLGAYSVAAGWGDGRVNLVAMQAVLALFKTPLPSAVTVTLELDGRPVLRGVLEGAQLREVLTVEGPVAGPRAGRATPAAGAGLAEAHHWRLVAEPAVPGLGYSLTFDSWLPWATQVPHDGLELALPARVAATVGKPLDVQLTAVAPSGVPLHIQHALPAGVQIDRPSLEARVAGGLIERFVAADGTLDLYTPALAPGTSFAITYRVIPTLAGVLHGGASLIEAGRHQFRVPPTEWTIR